MECNLDSNDALAERARPFSILSRIEWSATLVQGIRELRFVVAFSILSRIEWSATRKIGEAMADDKRTFS